MQSTHSGVDKLDILSSHSLKLCYLLLIALWRGEGGEGGRRGRGGERGGGEGGGGTYMTVHVLIHVHHAHAPCAIPSYCLGPESLSHTLQEVYETLPSSELPGTT